MRMRPWTAMWAGIVVLAACAEREGVLEQEAGDLDARIEKTAEVAAELEAAAGVQETSVVFAGGR